MSKMLTNKVNYDLQFNVAQLLKETTGEARHYEIEAHVDNPLDMDLAAVAPLVGQIKLWRTGPNILVTGTLRSAIQKSCGRCLTLFTAPITIDLEEEFYPTIDIVTGGALPVPDEADEANRIDEQNILDISEVVRQELILVSEGILYCKPDCKGLCPHCGQDRNVVVCDCQDSYIDPRWAGLQALKIDDK